MSLLSIIFDLDGTLLDTLGDIAETANAVLEYHGFPHHSPSDYQSFVGDGLQVLIKRITPSGTKEKILTDCQQLFLQLYTKNWANTCRPYEGIEAMLHTLGKMGIRMAVLSNKPDIFTHLFVDRYFSDKVFECVFGQREGFAKKPDPTVALAIAENLRLQPQHMLFVGDTGIDIRTGKAAGMGTVGVSWGFRSVQELQREHPDFIINSPMELVQYVLSFS